MSNKQIERKTSGDKIRSWFRNGVFGSIILKYIQMETASAEPGKRIIENKQTFRLSDAM